jgi:hypothetical protein
MDNQSLVELCVKITGAFEGGVPAYDTLTGNFDGMGMSAGVLQWNAGNGTLQNLLIRIAATLGWDKMQSFFVSDIHKFALLNPTQAVQWCVEHYLAEGSTTLAPDAKQRWQNLLNTPESIAAQIAFATDTTLSWATTTAAKYCPDTPTSTRAIAFFFDLVTQEGGMGNAKGKVLPLGHGVVPSVTDALNFAQQKDLKTAGMWEIALQNDPLAERLLYYAYHRSLLSESQYVWDTFSRRGSIGCKVGIVHGSLVNFQSILD